MTATELKDEIARYEKKVKNPILDKHAVQALNNKIQKFKDDLKKLEGGAKEVEKKVETKAKSVEKKVEAKTQKVEASAKKDVGEVKDEIAKLEKKLKNPIINASAKKAIQEKIDLAKAELKSIEPATKKEVKKVAKKVEAVAKKVEAVVEKKPMTRREQKKSAKQTAKPEAKKTAVAKKESPTVVVNGKKLSVEDCKEVLKQWSNSRKKAKTSQKKSKSRSTSTRVSANIVHAIETAIESVPAVEISENPTREINKFKKLVQSGAEFLKSFKSVLGDEYSTIDIKKQFEDVEKLIQALTKKYK